ncbi:galactose-3-O-sulfotransferase 2-like [Zonotrichia albicollis]|uniref:galactose-3-O-sulfotransferase 2-like n=1 Tax=Zonotrichia albicollis TaxID=44394 RepID=UPI003D80EF8B
MLKFKRYLITKLSAIYRCQPGRLWISFSLLVLLLITLQVVEKLQPLGSCQCELERDLQQTTGHELSSALHSPDLLWEDDSPQGQGETEPGAASTEDVFRMHLWTEAFKIEEVTPGEVRQARGVTSQGKTCKPKTDIVFLKVHKSASSTVMNILFRFGEMHNLTFAFPKGGGFQLYYPHHFLAKFVQGFSPLSPRRFNILCHHMRFLQPEAQRVAKFVQGFSSLSPPCFNILCHHMCFLQPEVQKVVPNSAIYFSILRNPVQLMESSFVYYKGASAFSRVRSLEEFLSQPWRYYDPARGDRHYARNLMTFDFGFNPDGDASPERVQLMLKAIEASFDILLISEYFDESMVLLKEMLCWDLDSVVSFPLNSRDSSTKSPLPDSVVEKLKAWNRLDWEIYTHFNRTFWERLDLLIGRERLRREVRALRQRQAELARACLQGTGSVGPKDIKDSSLRPLQHGGARILGYNLKQGLPRELERTCRRLVTPELQYSSLLYKKQFPPPPPPESPRPAASPAGAHPKLRAPGPLPPQLHPPQRPEPARN